MEIGLAIKQTKFSSTYQKALVNIIYTYGWIMEKMKAHFKEHDITPQQYNILRILRGSNPAPLTVLDLKERMLDKNCDASRITERLIAKGFVRKKICSSDKRRVDISITQKGMRLLQELDQYNVYLDEFLKGLTENEADLLNSLLDKLRSNYSLSKK